MSVEITVPSVGESVAEATLSRWIKEEGEQVQADEPVCELDTDKASTEVMAPVAGVLSIKVQAGETVTVGAVLGSIEEGEAPATKDKGAAPATKEKPPQERTKDTPRKEKPPPKEDTQEPQDGKQTEAPVVMPAARGLVAQHDLDVNQLQGTGRGGRVTKEDVLAYLKENEAWEKSSAEDPSSAKPAPSPSPPPPEPPIPQPQPQRTADRETRTAMSPIRQRIAARLLESQQTTASLTTFNEADLSAVMALRTQYKEAFQNKHGVGLGFMGFFVKACVEALRAFPMVNARIDGSDIVSHNYYNIGVAVSTDKGLLVPVIRDADQLSLAEIEKEMGRLAQKAREGKISVPDLQGGTFTITNGGVFGSMLSTPILNPPQSGILGMHSIQKRPVVRDDQIVIRPMMYLALSYDHRLIDGREAVRFLVRVKECVEAPERMLLEV